MNTYYNTRNDWFTRTFGFIEGPYEYVRTKFRLEEDDTVLVSLGNGRKFHIGPFETPSLEQLCHRIENSINENENDNNEERPSALTFEHIVGDVKKLHMNPKNAGAVFQAASQFNCLEMVSECVTPDCGITCYENDRTQGPICAMACSPGTIYRNYFVNQYGQGGEEGEQIDCLKEVGSILGNDDGKYWKMRNGYALPYKSKSLRELAAKIENDMQSAINAMGKLKVGVQWDTEVVVQQRTRAGSCTQSNHRVTQVYSSAIPIGYSRVGRERDFQAFAQLVLNATYEATFAVAAIKALETNQSVDLYLTKVGGGVFRNSPDWIVEAIDRCLIKYKHFPLNVHLVHYGQLDRSYVKSERITDYFFSHDCNKKKRKKNVEY